MVIRIDLLGVPGVGKSSIYSVLLKQRGDDNPLMSIDEVILSYSLNESKRDGMTVKDYILSFLINRNILRSIHPFFSQEIIHKHRDLMLWDEKDEVALDCLIKANALSGYPSSVRLLRYCWILESSRKIALLQNLKIPKDTTILVDDSLTQRLITLGPWNGIEEQKQLSILCSLLGELNSVVYLEAEYNTVMTRLQQRKKSRINTAHKQMNDKDLMEDTKKQLESARHVADKLESLGINIIRVNAEGALDEQVKFVKSQLNKI